MELDIPWDGDDCGLFASVRSRWGAGYYLVAEPIPADHVWDWAVWRHSDRPERARHGLAPSDMEAMAHAEAAVAAWEESLSAPGEGGDQAAPGLKRSRRTPPIPPGCPFLSRTPRARLFKVT